MNRVCQPPDVECARARWTSTSYPALVKRLTKSGSAEADQKPTTPPGFWAPWIRDGSDGS